MKLTNVNNLEGLFDVLNKCEGSVELVSKEGDRINMKSKLSQIISMASIFSNGYIKELELIVHEPSDMKKVVDFMMSDAHTKD